MSKITKSDHFEVFSQDYKSLKDKRIEQLMENCKQEILRQIIGPFGLTPAMFDDKDGGNVTTQHNAEFGIFAKEYEEFDRVDYDYSAAKLEKMKESVQSGTMNSQEFKDQYTGNWEPTRRTKSNGKQAMNAELDHTIPLKDIHRNGGWMKDGDGRTKLSSTKENLNYTTFQINRKKGAKKPGDALSEENGFDKWRIDPIVEQAKEAIEKELPNTSERIKYHSKDLATEGAKSAGKNAFRQAFGVVLHEFVNGSFVEINVLIKERGNDLNLIDQLVESLKRVMNRVINKLKSALDAAFHGGVQGFISDLLTFLINNLITTSKKIVTIIRESMKSLWDAIKLMVNPPKDMSTLEITRNITKIIAAIITTGMGLMMEESVNAFITSIPVLAPIADVLATGITAIMTGISGALIVYGIDHLFDWLSSSGTELMKAQEVNAEEKILAIGHLQEWLSLQYENSHLYAMCAEDYQQIKNSYSAISFQMTAATLSVESSIQDKISMIECIETQIDRKRKIEEAIKFI